MGEHIGSVVEFLTRDRGAAGLSLTCVVSSSKTHLSLLSTGSTQEDLSWFAGGKPRNYHEIVLTQICSQATSGTRRGSFQAENWIKKGWCHVHFCFILQLRTDNGEIRQCSSV